MEKVFEHLAQLTRENPIAVSEYVGQCLYNPQWGYYAKKRLRVGALGDFYTSSSIGGGVFSELLKESAQTLLDKYFAKENEFKIFEIGAEPDAALFKNSRVISFFDEALIDGNAFVFSNELLDARPFDRFLFKGGVQKMFVKFFKDGTYETSFANASEAESEYLLENFDEFPDGFLFDFSFDALNLLRKICTQNWRGVLIFADYFRSKNELLEFPKGTARIYKKHRANADIFLQPSECDITFSPPFEVFVKLLNSLGFKDVNCASQSAFFMENSQKKIREIVENEAPLSVKKSALSELLSPACMGEMFRVLSAVKK